MTYSRGPAPPQHMSENVNAMEGVFEPDPATCQHLGERLSRQIDLKYRDRLWAEEVWDSDRHSP